ncbi:MAG: hypothetical protein M1838_001646 [Thelocarpon superellum]|nr:MAG: hypothetical protein M1838_001646 [Thelocarpon superellum]
MSTSSVGSRSGTMKRSHYKADSRQQQQQQQWQLPQPDQSRRNRRDSTSSSVSPEEFREKKYYWIHKSNEQGRRNEGVLRDIRGTRRLRRRESGRVEPSTRRGKAVVEQHADDRVHEEETFHDAHDHLPNHSSSSSSAIPQQKLGEVVKAICEGLVTVESKCTNMDGKQAEANDEIIHQSINHDLYSWCPMQGLALPHIHYVLCFLLLAYLVHPPAVLPFSIIFFVLREFRIEERFKERVGEFERVMARERKPAGGC